MGTDNMRIAYCGKGVSMHDIKRLRILADRLGHEVHLVSYHSGALKDVEGIVVHHISLPDARFGFPLASILTPWLIRRIKPDVVVGSYLVTYGFLAALANTYPLLQIAWGSDILVEPYRNKVFARMVRFALQKANMVLVDSLAGKKSAIRLGCIEDQVLVAPVGIDTATFRPRDGSLVRTHLGWDKNVVVTCTRDHEPVYGIEYLINAIPHVLDVCPNARFLFLSAGSLTAKFKQMAAELDIGNAVKFMGMVQNQAVAEYLAASDIYVSPALSDGTSVALMEAMACGLPVLVTDWTTNMEWVTDGENGIVLPRRDSCSIANGLVSLIQCPSLRKKFGNVNCGLASDRISLEHYARVLEQSLNSVVRERAS